MPGWHLYEVRLALTKVEKFSRSVFDVWKFAKEKRIIEILNVREFFLSVRNLWSKAWLQMIIIKDSVEKKGSPD